MSCYNQHGIQSYSMRSSSDFIANNITKTFRHKNYYWIFQQNYMTSFIHNDNLYLPLKMQIVYLTFILQALWKDKDMPSNWPTPIIGDFNIYMIINTSQSTKSQNFVNNYNCSIVPFKSTNICNITQMNHIWINAPTQQCHFGSTKAYWIDHKPIIYVALNY